MRRSRVDTLEPTADPDPVVEPAAVVAARSAVAIVDDALRGAPGRELVERAEAMALLHRVESVTHDLPAGDRVRAIVDGVDHDSSGQVLLAHSTLVDALLDVRSELG